MAAAAHPTSRFAPRAGVSSSVRVVFFDGILALRPRKVAPAAVRAQSAVPTTDPLSDPRESQRAAVFGYQTQPTNWPA